MHSTVSHTTPSDPSLRRDVEMLLSHLQGTDILLRRTARELLGQIGRCTVPCLIELLSHRNEHVRWEACKILGCIGDPKAGPPLAAALLDDSMDVRWVAAEALVSLELHAVEPLLVVLEQHFDSVFVREATHHVLHSLKRDYIFDEHLNAVYHALTLNVQTPRLAVAAMTALDHVRGGIFPPMRRRVRHLLT